MDEITLTSEHEVQVTCISNIFIDEYMPSANGEYVKVYLYLLRCLSDNRTGLNLSKITETFEYTNRDLLRAFGYWERMGLLELTYNEDKQLKNVTLLDPISHLGDNPPSRRSTHHEELKSASAKIAPVGPSIPADVPSARVVPPVEPSTRKEYSSDELASFSGQSEVEELIFVAEHYIGHPLSPAELQAFLYWFDTLHFPVDLIEYLVEYCVNRGHKNIRYMDKVAMAWDEVGIRSAEQAKKSANLYNQANYAVIKALGIKGRNLVESEISLIEKWTKEYQFSLDIITEACNRTISATHQPSFEYTDKILGNWKKSNVKELSDIEALDLHFAQSKKQNTLESKPVTKNTYQKASVNSFNNFTQRTYDYDQLEQQMLNRNRN